jgi:hypothetical protein
MPRNFIKLGRSCGGESALPILLGEHFGRSEEGPGPWVSLVTETVWNGFYTPSCFTRLLKTKRSPLSFLHKKLGMATHPQKLDNK